MEKGYVQVYTGNGKGKTTAALGLGLRAAGRGFKVVMFQFLKGTFSGELESVKRLSPNFEIRRLARIKKFFWSLNDEEKRELKKRVEDEYDRLFDCIKKGEYDIVILDEVMGAIHAKLLSVEDVCNLIDNKSPNVELVLTGRNAPEEIMERADLVTEMKPIKHYFDKGVKARDGIER